MRDIAVHSARVAAACIVMCVSAVAVSATDWPAWRGPEGNGISPERSWDPQSLERNPKIQWSADIGTGYSSVVIAGGLVFTMGNERNTDTVYCFDAGNGKSLWTYSYRCSTGSYPGPKATPVVDGGVLYTLSQEGHLFAFNASDGEIMWSRHLRDDYGVRPPAWNFSGSPVIYGDLLIFNAGTSGLAINKKTGREVWDSGRGPGGYATPVLYDLRGAANVAIFGERYLYAVDVGDGDVLWSYPWRTGSDVNAADPVVADGKVFISSAYNRGSAALDFSSGRPELLWESDAYESHFSSFVEINGYIYGNDGDARSPRSGTYRCVEFSTGRVMWSVRIGFGSLIAAGDKLIMLTYDGKITVARATPYAFEETASGSLPRNQYWTPPSLSDSRLYVRNVRGDLYCVDLR